MDAPIDILWYGDQSADLNGSLEQLLKERDNSPQLSAFLRNTWTKLGLAVTEIPLRDRLPFQGGDFQHLSRIDPHARSPAVSCVLICVVQIGWTIRYRENFPENWEQSRPLAVGICTGALSAIAAAAAKSESDLAILGGEIVLCALRLGVEVSQRSACLEEGQDSWTAIISGFTELAMHEHLQSFHASHNIPAHQRLYISAKTSTACSLSGPPSLIHIFLASDCMRDARVVRLPISGAYHAKHLPLPDLSKIVPKHNAWNRVWPVNAPLPWLGDITPDPKQDFHSMLQSAVFDILQMPVNLETLVNRITATTDGRPVRFVKIGPGYLGKLVQSVPRSTVFEFGLDKTAPDQQSPATESEPIAIVGMAGKFPDAENPEELWDILMKGLDLHREIPPSRFDVTTHYDPTGKTRNTTLTPYGCFYDHMDAFDLAMFRMSPREAAQTDPMQRLMLITAYEALENAGYYDPGQRAARPKVGTFYGQGGDDYRQCNSSQDVDTSYITGGIRAFGPGRVSYHFKWSGPSMTVDTACSASAVAVHQACSSLWRRECDTALAGGANLLTCSDMFAGLSRASFLSPTGGCKTLDEDADGYCRAECVATVVLKRLDQALENNDNILGVIRSIKTNHAPNAISITHPHSDAQTALFQSVLNAAGSSIYDVDHVEMHGTGTQAGDVAETTSIYNLLSEPRSKERPLFLGAVKPNVGHSEAASGVTSLIKALLILRHNIVPRHIGIKSRINPKIPDLSAMNIRIPLQHEKLRLGSSVRKILVNNFNATGGSTALLLEEYQQATPTRDDSRSYQPITISAATPKSLLRSIENLIQHIRGNRELSLHDLSYTLTARRMHHEYRFACVSKDLSSLSEILARYVSRSLPAKRCKGDLSIVFVFTGQASYYPGMGAQIFETCAVFRNQLIYLDQICRNLGLPSFLALITNADPENISVEPATCQLAIVGLEMALIHVLESWGIHPTAVVGHSLGEYSALYAAKVLGCTDVLFLVGNRALAMQNKCAKKSHAMLAVATSAEEAQERLIDCSFSNCQVACVNGPSQTVISGPIKELENLHSTLQVSGVKAKILETAFAFHSGQMDPILHDVEQMSKGIKFHSPCIPVGSTSLGRVIREGGVFNAVYLRQQVREPVLFQQAIKALAGELQADSTFWLELGPAPTCSTMVSSIIGTKQVSSILDPKLPNWHTVANALTEMYHLGGNPYWDEYHKEYEQALKLVQLPSYPFDFTSHWINYEGAWQITKNQGHMINPAVARELTQSITLHRLESDVFDNGIRKVLFSSDFARPDLHSLISHGLKQGTLTCIAGMFSDMALTAAQHVWGDSELSLASLEISNLQFGTQPHLDPNQDSHPVSLTVTQDCEKENNLQIVITNNGSEYARCWIKREDTQRWVSKLEKKTYLIESRMALLELNASLGTFTKQKQDEMYAAVGSKFGHGNTFHSLQEVIFDKNSLEGKALVGPKRSNMRCTINPHGIDAVLQLPLLLLNMSSTLPTATAFLYQGWRRMRTTKNFQADRIYGVHARFHSSSSLDEQTSDIHVLDSTGQIVALIQDLTFKAVKIGSLHSVPFQPVHFTPLASEASSQWTSRSPSTLAAEPITPDTALQASTLEPKLSSRKYAFGDVIEVIASEIGVDPQTITDETSLDQLGVDSLMQIPIMDKLRETIAGEVPSSLLIQCNRVSDLREFFENDTCIMLPA